MEFLKEALGEDFEAFREKIAQFEKESGSQMKLANLADGGYVSREKYDALSGQIEKIREESKKTFKEEIEGLKIKMKTAEKDHAVDMAIKNSGARNVKAVKALLDLENADAQSVENQLEAIRSENAYLFEKPVTYGATGMRQGSAKKETSAEDELRQRLFGKN